jgi:hypothetical protein
MIDVAKFNLFWWWYYLYDEMCWIMALENILIFYQKYEHRNTLINMFLCLTDAITNIINSYTDW